MVDKKLSDFRIFSQTLQDTFHGKTGVCKVILAPFMIVAGDHAKNDMAGDDPESWYSQFKAAGFQVEPVVKGLGEYPGVRSLLVDHLKAAAEA